MARILAVTGFVFGVALAVMWSGGDSAFASPYDAHVGETRVVFERDGTVIRAEPEAIAASTGTLRKGTRIVVQEVKQPWLRVNANMPGRGTVTGWLRSSLTVEPSALGANPRPAFRRRGGGAGVSQQELSAAGRQFNAATERGYRQSRADLNRAYPQVDAMQDATVALDPSDSVAFIQGGVLGRPRQDYVRPGLLPPDPVPPRRARPRGQPPRGQQPRRGQSGGLGGLARGLGGMLGGSAGRALGEAANVAEQASPYFEDIMTFQRQVSQRFTPEQEYYLGRAVAASAIAKYGVDPDCRRREYVRRVGDAVVRLTTRLPANFGGYHFEVLNSNEINGISGPGGFVLLTRGAVDACRSEDELAAVLCHELAHVQLKHGEQTVRKGRSFQSGLKMLTSVGSRAAGFNENQALQRMVQFFSKVVGEMATTSLQHNYGRNAEYQADVQGTYMLYDVLYDHVALRDYLVMLQSRPGRAYGMAATHSPPASRANYVNQALGRLRAYPGSERLKQVRVQRLNEALGRAAPPR